MDDDRPLWARRIRSERAARGWSQADAVRAMRSHGRLSGQESLVRQWKRWEAGEVEPGNHHKRLIARTFGTVTAALFPPDRGDVDGDLVAVTGMDTLEIVSRLRATDVSQSTLDALAITADRLGCEYSRRPPAELHAEGLQWLRRLYALLDRRLTLSQHREVMALAGQVALLVGCVEYDMGRRQPAESTRRAALSLGEEAGDTNTVGWAYEMRAWYALTQGQYRSAVTAAQTGSAIVGDSHSVAVQLAALRAKAWARMGDRRQVEVALNEGRDLLEAMPYPENLDNHFVVDPSKWDFYTMDCYRHVGEDRLADEYARQVLRNGVGADGVERGPMRNAEARITLGVVSARGGDLEGALLYGRQALAGARQSLPSLAMVARELGSVLVDRFADEPEAHLYMDEIRALAA